MGYFLFLIAGFYCLCVVVTWLLKVFFDFNYQPFILSAKILGILAILTLAGLFVFVLVNFIFSELL